MHNFVIKLFTKMKRRQILTLIFGVIALAINVLIIVESCINGEGSSSQSLGFTNMIVNILEKIFPNTPITEDREQLHAIVRKLFGHFLLFGLSGIFTTLTLLVRLENPHKKDWIINGSISAGIGLTIAAISEFIQAFQPGRAGLPSDVLIDFSGYLLFGSIVFVIYMLVYYKISSKKETR